MHSNGRVWTKRWIAALVATAAVAVALVPAASAQTQTGLVNVAVGDVTVQLPVALAANLCDVNVAVLVGQFVDAGDAQCDARADADGMILNGGNRGNGGGPNQVGLVNVAIGDITVQAPIGIAVNICDVNAAILVGQFFDTGSATCNAVADADGVIHWGGNA